MLLDEGDHLLRRAHLVRVGRDGVNDVGCYDAAGAVHHRQLAAGAKAGIEPHDRDLTDRCLKEQRLQVGAEHGDRLGLGPLAHLGADFIGDGRPQQALVAVRRGLADLPAAGGFERQAPGAAQALGLALVVDPQIRNQEALAFAAEDGQQTVGGDVPPRLVMLEVVAVGGRLGVLLLLGEDAHAQRPLHGEHAAQLGAFGGILGKPRGQDVPRTGQRRVRILNPLLRTDELARQLRGEIARRGAGQQRIRQRLQPLLASDLGPGTALGLVGKIEILQLLLGESRANGLLQVLRDLALLADALQDGIPALGQLQEVFPALEQDLELKVLEAPRRLLAIPGHEGDGRPLRKELGGGLHLLRPAPHLRGDDFDEARFEYGGLAHGVSFGRTG